EDLRDRSPLVGGRRGRYQVTLQVSRLNVHVGEQVDGCLLHRLHGPVRIEVHAVGVRIGAVAGNGRRVVVEVVKPPRVLYTTGSEHERAALHAIEGQVVRGRAGVVHRAVVLDVRNAVDDGLRQVDDPRAAEAVVEIFVPFVPEDAV